jgi:hypothetical protein
MGGGMRKIAFLSVLALTASVSYARAEDFMTVVRRCNSPIYDKKLMRACGMLATQANLSPINHAIAYDLRARAYLELGYPDYAILDTTMALQLLDRPDKFRKTDPVDIRLHALAIRSAAYAKTGKVDNAITDRMPP